MKRKSIAFFTVISTLIAIFDISFRYLLPLLLTTKDKVIKPPKSVGIIGGADGPTSIILSDTKSSALFTVILSILAVSGILYLFLTRKKSYKQKKSK